MCFPRAESSVSARWHGHAVVCTALAHMLTRWLDEGAVPATADFAHSVVTTLLKRGKGGVPLDGPSSAGDS